MKRIYLNELSLEEFEAFLARVIDARFNAHLLHSEFKTADDDELWSRKEMCKYLKISLPTGSRLYKEGVIKGIRVSNKLLFSKAGVLKSLDLINNKKYSKRAL